MGNVDARLSFIFARKLRRSHTHTQTDTFMCNYTLASEIYCYMLGAHAHTFELQLTIKLPHHTFNAKRRGQSNDY